MKYEWKATWKLLLPANALILVMTILAWFMIKMMDHADDFDMMGFMMITVTMTYVISMFAVSIGTGIFLIYRFYTSTYGDQGYLLHTLPVDTHHIIIAKVVVSAAWELITIMSIYTSVLILFSSISEFLESMMYGLKHTIESMGAGTITAFTVVMTLIAFLFSLLAKVLKVGACISLGQLSANHKLLLSFAWYFGIYVVEQIIQGIYFAIQLLFLNRVSGSTYRYFDTQWETTLIAGIISCVIYYLVTWYVMSRKLNLD